MVGLGIEILVALHGQAGAANGNQRVSSGHPPTRLGRLYSYHSFCVDLSYLYSKLVTTYSRGMEAILPDEEEASDSDDDEESALLPESAKQHLHLTPGVRHFMAM